GEEGTVGNDVGGNGGAGGPRSRRWIGGAFHVDFCAYRRDADPAGGLSFPRIRGGPHGCGLHRQSLCIGQRSQEAGRVFPTLANVGHSFDGTFVHNSAALGDKFWQLVLDSPPDSEAYRTSDGTAGRVLPIKTKKRITRSQRRAEGS